jgi:hypothetical protein
MKRHFRAVAFCVAFLGCAVPAYAATCAPAKLVHIVTVNVTPGVPAGYPSQPLNMYRIGSDKMRTEEAPDLPNRIHGVVVTAEPDTWMANLYDHTGKHIIDPGPTFFAKAPIVYGLPGFPQKFMDLEFGCEADFIAANALTPSRSEQIRTSRYDVYRSDGGTGVVEILERPGTSTPAFVRYYHDGKLLLAIRYDLYATGLPSDPSLFLPPAGVQYEDVSQR